MNSFSLSFIGDDDDHLLIDEYSVELLKVDEHDEDDECNGDKDRDEDRLFLMESFSIQDKK